MRDFHIEREQRGPVYLLRLAGAVDMYSYARLDEQVRQLFSQNHHQIILDCQNLDYIGSAGLGSLVGLAKEARAHGGDVRLLRVPERIYKIIELLGFTKVLQVFQDETAAINSFAS